MPEFKTVPLHIFGESYGGKMGVEFAYELYKEIQEGKIESNLIGVYLGDAWTSPIDYTLSWAPYLLNLVRSDAQFIRLTTNNHFFCHKNFRASLTKTAIKR